jgi:hypothetical protein
LRIVYARKAFPVRRLAVISRLPLGGFVSNPVSHKPLYR